MLRRDCGIGDSANCGRELMNLSMLQGASPAALRVANGVRPFGLHLESWLLSPVPTASLAGLGSPREAAAGNHLLGLLRARADRGGST